VMIPDKRKVMAKVLDPLRTNVGNVKFLI